jgi:hypothetical protein
MAHAVARPEDILLAYNPDTVSIGNQASPLEVHGGRRSFHEMTGGADTYHEDFTSGLRDFVTARAAASGGGTDSLDRGSTLIGGWFGGAGADPSALVMGLDWLADNGDEKTSTGVTPEEDDPVDDDISEDGAPPAGLMGHVIPTGAPLEPSAQRASSVRRSPEIDNLSSFMVASSAPDGLEAELRASDILEAAAGPPETMGARPARPGRPARPNNLAGRGVLDLGMMITDTRTRADSDADDFVVVGEEGPATS